MHLIDFGEFMCCGWFFKKHKQPPLSVYLEPKRLEERYQDAWRRISGLLINVSLWSNQTEDWLYLNRKDYLLDLDTLLATLSSKPQIKLNKELYALITNNIQHANAVIQQLNPMVDASTEDVSKLFSRQIRMNSNPVRITPAP